MNMDEIRLTLHRLLIEMNITQKKLAQKSDISESTIGKFLSGKRKNISASTILAIAHALEVPLEVLYGSENSIDYEVGFIKDMLENFDQREKEIILSSIKKSIQTFSAYKKYLYKKPYPKNTL